MLYSTDHSNENLKISMRFKKKKKINLKTLSLKYAAINGDYYCQCNSTATFSGPLTLLS